MKNCHLLNFPIFIGLIVVDQLSKSWPSNFKTMHFNHGFFMGVFAYAPDSLRVVFLASVAALLFSLYCLSLYMLPPRAKYMKIAISIIMAGLFGNVIDRLRFGATRDFIPLIIGKTYYLFNLADICLWIGAVTIIWILLRKDHMIWHDYSNRRRFIVNFKEQVSLASQVTFIVFNCCLLLGIFSYSVLKVNVPKEMLNPNAFILAFSALCIYLCLLSFFIGIIMSHRRLGPLFAFDKFVDDLIEGKDRNFRVREVDHYKHLEKTAEKLRKFSKDK